MNLHDVLAPLVSILERHRIAYAVIGGYAVAAWGELRATRDEFIIAGTGLIVTFAPRSGDAVAGIASLDEGVFADGKWVPGRRMNGDQSHQGRHLHLPGNAFGIQKLRLYLYK